MRYSATTLRGCLVELLARFRRNPTAEMVLAAVTGIEEAEEPYNGTAALVDRLDVLIPGRTAAHVEGLTEWLSRQRLVVLHMPAT